MDNTSNSRINRINYIVQENPSGVSQTLAAEGFNPSTDVNTLIQQTKQWIQQDGKEAVVKLLKVHPEKDAILSANKAAYEYFGGCGCKSSFDGSACVVKIRLTVHHVPVKVKALTIKNTTRSLKR